MFEKSNATLEKLGAVITTREIQQEPKLWLETLAICQQHQAKLADLLASFELKRKPKDPRDLHRSGDLTVCGGYLSSLPAPDGGHEPL